MLLLLGERKFKKKKEKNEKEQSIEWVECGVGRDGSPRGLYVIIGICAMFDVHSGWTQLLYRSGGGSATGSPSSSFCAPPGHVFRFAYPPPLALLDPQNFEWTGIRGAWLFGHTFSAHSGRGRNKKKKFKLISMMEEILSRFSFFFFISWPTEVEKRSRCHPQANLHIKWFETLCCVERLIKKKKKKIKEWWSLLFLFQNFLWRLHLISFGRQRRTRRATFSWAFGSSLHVIPARVLLFFPLSHLYMWNNILRLLFHRTVRLWNFLLVEKKKNLLLLLLFPLLPLYIVDLCIKKQIVVIYLVGADIAPPSTYIYIFRWGGFYLFIPGSDQKGGWMGEWNLAIWRVLNYETMLTGGGGLALLLFLRLSHKTFLFRPRILAINKLIDKHFLICWTFGSVAFVFFFS